MSKHSVEEIKAVILGHAVGDALGVPVEFQTREGLEADPVTDMVVLTYKPQKNILYPQSTGDTE